MAADWVERYGTRIDSYRFPKGENVRQKWAKQVGRDGFTVLEAASAPEAPGWLRKISAVQVLRRAWGEQYHRGGEGHAGGRRRTSRRAVSPYDLDARYGLKRGLGWCGYRRT
ncbi:hypothetical protein [Streptomyces yunnanensis]|uniref:Uncharacterized protein n=1 Tax=Streptomyces yunnanensis TaxID=156453 RepID=A0A9X8N985_9ACTN|nr:hypothetical protein [Streptomyces yunnanensis]SHN32482.1 hypothetical protein SAMN05216268_13630 [Streptomyces yunnanensis]